MVTVLVTSGCCGSVIGCIGCFAGWLLVTSPEEPTRFDLCFLMAFFFVLLRGVAPGSGTMMPLNSCAIAAVAPTSTQPESRSCRLGLARIQARVAKAISAIRRMLNQIKALRPKDARPTPNKQM